MDKYEFRIKTDQIKKLMQQKDYPAAMKIADTIDWSRVKNMSLLTIVSEVYERNEHYEESLDIMLMVYERYPAGRTVVYKLCELFIQLGNYKDAVEFYQEYVKIAPYDTSRLVLKYKICKGQGKDLDTLIRILEDLKSQDYHEEWAYELARLYHQARRIEQCVAECDEIDLWFGEGYYVTKALELKMRYQPLTPVQMKKYENRYAYQEEGEGLEEIDLDGKDPEIKVRTFTFDTLGLQAELAKSIDQLMNAPDKESVSSTMENVKRLVEESQIPEIAPEPIVYEEILSEDEDGQISLYVPEQDVLEKQITGQMTIEDILNEWEKTKESAERAIEESRLRQLEIARSRAIAETGNIMERLKDVLPTAETDRDVVRNAMEGMEEMERTKIWIPTKYHKEEREPVSEVFPKELEEVPFIATETMTEEMAAAVEPEEISVPEMEEPELQETETAEPEMPAPDTVPPEVTIPETTEPEVELPALEAETVEEIEEVEEADEDDFDIPEITVSEQVLASIPDEPVEEVEAESGELEEEPEAAEEKIGEPEEASQEKEPEHAVLEVEEDLWPTSDELYRASMKVAAALAQSGEKKPYNPEIEEVEEVEERDEKPREEVKEEIEKKKPRKNKNKEVKKAKKGVGFNAEQREILSYFIEIPEVAERLEEIGKNYNASSFIMISGAEGSGRTSLATRLIKAAQLWPDSVGKKIARTTGAALNKKSVPQIFEKMAQGSLIVEKAEELSQETLNQLYQEMERYENRLQIYFIGRTKPLTAALKRNEELYQACKHRIVLPIYRNDDLVTFARAYARGQKYSIGDMGVLALYTRIGAMQTQSHQVMLGEVKELVDEAIANSGKFTPKKFFGKLFATHIDEDGLIVLNEQDFQEKETEKNKKEK